MSATLQRLASGWADVVFPPVCVDCRGLVEDGGPYRHLCARCASRLEFIRAPHCPTCGHPYYGAAEEGRRCEHCVTLEPAFREGRAAVLLKGPARALVLALKYHGGEYVREDVAAVFRRAPALLAFVRGAQLVPVPLHPRKERERGYNQSALIAACLAEAAGGGTRPAPLLRRVLDTPTQTALDRRTRQENLKNAFAPAAGGTLNPALHYILVDDVFTTGSTLNRCAATLRRAGALKLDVGTFGHG